MDLSTINLSIGVFCVGEFRCVGNVWGMGGAEKETSRISREVSQGASLGHGVICLFAQTPVDKYKHWHL